MGCWGEQQTGGGETLLEGGLWGGQDGSGKKELGPGGAGGFPRGGGLGGFKVGKNVHGVSKGGGQGITGTAKGGGGGFFFRGPFKGLYSKLGFSASFGSPRFPRKGKGQFFPPQPGGRGVFPSPNQKANLGTRGGGGGGAGTNTHNARVSPKKPSGHFFSPRPWGSGFFEKTQPDKNVKKLWGQRLAGGGGGTAGPGLGGGQSPVLCGGVGTG